MRELGAGSEGRFLQMPADAADVETIPYLASTRYMILVYTTV